MGKNQETKKIRVKELRKEVQQKLAVALADYKNGWPDEKYNKTLKRASKLFVTDLERVEQKVRSKNKKKKTEQVHEDVNTGE
jgi:uncharacterized iron-regulated protein